MKITIARQCGSGGHEIAEALAEKLHLEIFDKKRFVEEAKKRNVYDENANFLNERPIDSFLYSIAIPFICMQTERSDVREYRNGIRYQKEKP